MAFHGVYQGETPTCASFAVGTNLSYYCRRAHAIAFNADRIITSLEQQLGYQAAYASSFDGKTIKLKDDKLRLFKIKIKVKAIPNSQIDPYLNQHHRLFGVYKPDPHKSGCHAVSVESKYISKSGQTPTPKLVCYNSWRVKPTVYIDVKDFIRFSLITADVIRQKQQCDSNGNNCQFVDHYAITANSCAAYRHIYNQHSQNQQNNGNAASQRRRLQLNDAQTSAAPTCARGHPLKRTTPQQLLQSGSWYRNGFVCSKCRGSFGGCASYHCWRCRYDLCSKCYH